MQTLLAVLLVLSGFTLYALFYFYKEKHWNGFKSKENLVVALAIIVIMSVLMVNVPDVAATLKAFVGLDVNIENSKVGFCSLGFVLASMLGSNHKKKSIKQNDAVDQL